MRVYKNRNNIWEALGMLLVGRSSNCYYYFLFSFLVGMNHLFPMFPKEALDLCALVHCAGPPFFFLPAVLRSN